MVALYDYDPRESSPNIDVQVRPAASALRTRPTLRLGPDAPHPSLQPPDPPLSLLGDGAGAPGPVNGRQTLGAACGRAPDTAGTVAQGPHGGGPGTSP